MPILLIALIAAGAVWAGRTAQEIPFAVRGKTSPARQLKLEKFRAKQGNSERRYGFLRYLADLWASCWKDALKVRLDTTDQRVHSRTQKAIRKHDRRIEQRDRRWDRRDIRRRARQDRRDARRRPVPVDVPSGGPEAVPVEPCAGCGKTGHHLPYCENPTLIEGEPCGGCGKTGHGSDDCPWTPEPGIPAGPSQPKENPVSASAETTTVGSLRSAMEAKVKEATAELEDARANANRAAGELARADQMVASLASQDVPQQTIAKIQRMQENAAAAKKTADARAALADADVALARAALNDVQGHEHVREAGAAVGGVADSSFYEMSQAKRSGLGDIERGLEVGKFQRP